MNNFEKFFSFFTINCEQSDIPTLFGWFHIMFILIVLGITLFLYIFKKNANEKFYRLTVFIWWIIMFSLEIIKQISRSMEIVNDQVVWKYLWYSFPFQLCSMPLYLFPFIVFLKDSKFRDSLVSFCCFFAMFGGITVFAYPGQVFVRNVFLDIQTMIHHGGQIIVGIYSLVYYKDRINFNYFIKGTIVFIVTCLIAFALNEIVYNANVLSADDQFNMFYISRHFGCSLPLVGMLFPLLKAGESVVGYIIFLLIYILGFTLIGFIVFELSNIKKNKTC